MSRPTIRCANTSRPGMARRWGRTIRLLGFASTTAAASSTPSWVTTCDRSTRSSVVSTCWKDCVGRQARGSEWKLFRVLHILAVLRFLVVLRFLDPLPVPDRGRILVVAIGVPLQQAGNVVEVPGIDLVNERRPL